MRPKGTGSDVVISSVKTDDFEVEYFSFGTGARPLLILPGLYPKSIMTLAEAVSQAYRRFAEDYTVYVFDRRRIVPPVYPVRDMAGDTAVALDRLGIRDACLFGVSMGAAMAQVIAIERPELVRRLVLGSTAPHVTAQAEHVTEAWARLAECGDLDALGLSFAETVYSGNFFKRYREALLSSLDGASQGDLDRFAILARGLKDFDVREELGRIRCPVLVLGASEDRIFGPEGSLEIADKLRCACHIYEGYGHGVYDEAPDYLDRVEKFFRQQEAID